MPWIWEGLWAVEACNIYWISFLTWIIPWSDLSGPSRFYLLLIEHVITHNQYALMETFFSSAWSPLLCPDSTLVQRFLNLPKNEEYAENLRCRMSFRHYVNSIVDQEPTQARLLLDPQATPYLFGQIKTWIDDHHVYWKQFCLGWHCLWHVAKRLRGDLRKSKVELLILTLSPDFTQSDYFMNAARMIKYV